MEKAYFESRHKYPGKEEYAYLRLALQSRYPDKPETEIHELVSECRSLDDAIVAAIGVDFGHHVALRIRMDVLWNLPACSRCGKYRALSTTDNLCYGCRKFPGFTACSQCRLYWDDYPRACRQCGGPVWRITDGPGVPMIPLSQDGQGVIPGSLPSDEVMRQVKQEGLDEERRDTLGNLKSQLENLEKRCAAVWDADLQERREYIKLRRVDPKGAREARSSASSAKVDTTLVQDLDRFFDAVTRLYLRADSEGRDKIRTLMGAHKRLLGNMHGYAGRSASKLKQSGNSECLLGGLVAVSIDDGRSCQDYGSVLGHLYRSALECGLKPSEFFSAVANLSNGESRGVLGSFESSHDFAVFVGPYLKNKA